MATISIYSLKGGVGKTTLAVNLAWAAAAQSARRTLLWDFDPQAASSFLLARKAPKGEALAIFSKDVGPDKLIRPTATPGLDLIPADASLRELDLLFHQLDKKKRLAKLLEDLTGEYDRILLDCPPGLTETNKQAMRAADLIVVPVIPSPLSRRAFEELIGYLGTTKRVLPVHVMVDRRRKLHGDVVDAEPGWPAIPMASVIEQMGVRRAPVGVFAPRSPAAEAFAGLWRAVEQWLA
ncbi:MAG: ParA family protein [Sphingomonas sp.]|uniref:ParA family protein n=1 Tax=Sphingomonas sp. TaxID=28214 RepID=UPI001AC1B7EE|nr:ParA family protein [Sphingomonas sp.]MBN8808328.1 ParA family protein [Sphingomonas sp.]